MRGRRAFIVMLVHIILLSLLAIIIYATVYYDEVNRTYYNANIVTVAEYGPDLGQAIFSGTILLLFAIFSFVAPAFGAGAIAGERERQTYDTLLLTSLRARHIVFGKLGAIFLLLVLFILVSWPIQSIAYLFGGVALADVIVATIGLLITAWAFSTVGLYISSLVRTTTTAVTITYAIIMPLVYGIPFLIFFLFEGPPSYYLDDLSNGPLRILYAYSTIFLMSINPFFATILTGEAAMQGDGYFLYRTGSVGPLNYPGSLWVISPWLGYSLFYLFLALLLLRFSVRRVAKLCQH
jgi:ABC-type transport system involved in multi-copper enzyme maturation permease subunit